MSFLERLLTTKQQKAQSSRFADVPVSMDNPLISHEETLMGGPLVVAKVAAIPGLLSESIKEKLNPSLERIVEESDYPNTAVVTIKKGGRILSRHSVSTDKLGGVNFIQTGQDPDEIPLGSAMTDLALRKKYPGAFGKK